MFRHNRISSFTFTFVMRITLIISSKNTNQKKISERKEIPSKQSGNEKSREYEIMIQTSSKILNSSTGSIRQRIACCKWLLSSDWAGFSKIRILFSVYTCLRHLEVCLRNFLDGKFSCRHFHIRRHFAEYLCKFLWPKCP